MGYDVQQFGKLTSHPTVRPSGAILGGSTETSIPSPSASFTGLTPRDATNSLPSRHTKWTKPSFPTSAFTIASSCMGCTGLQELQGWPRPET
jgi:hypothetical protein